MRIKEIYYGEYSESLITALKNLGGIQYMNNKIDESIATLERAVNNVNKVISANKIKDKNYFKQNSTEVVILLMSVLERQFGQPVDHERLRKVEETLVKIQESDNNAVIAQFLMLKAKKMQITPGTDSNLVLETIQRAVTI